MFLFSTFREFFKYAPTHRKAIYFTVFACSIMYILGLFYVFPGLDAASVRVGLSVIVGILGVLLGAILLVVERQIDHGQEGMHICKSSYPKYKELIEQHIDEIDKEGKRLIKLVKEKEINIDTPAFGGLKGISPSKTKYRDIIGNLIVLSFILKRLDINGIEASLKDIGLSDKEVDEFEFGKGVIGAYNSAKFLKIVDDALYYPFISEWSNEKLEKLSSKILSDYNHEGIDKALEKVEGSKSIMGSKLLGFGIFMLSSTTFGSIILLFSTTKNTVSTPIYYWLVICLFTCFFVSILVTLVLLEKIFIRI